ncbi:MAG: hypothetical protein ACT4N9_00290 [Paracoccaceae bacterium]
MQMVMEQVRGVRVLVNLNWDLIFSVGTVVAGLLAGAFLGESLRAF